MDVGNLSSLISALRAESGYASITPESLGSLLQKIVDVLSTASLQSDMQQLQSWKNVLQRLEFVCYSIVPGTSDKNNIFLSEKRVNLANGNSYTVPDSLSIPMATTTTAGAMSSRHVRDIDAMKSLIAENASSLESLSSLVSSIIVSPSQKNGTTFIACDTKDDMLFVSGARSLVNAGYVPYIFRYTVKRNRVTDPLHVKKHVRGPKRKGWHMFYDDMYVKVKMADESLLFNYIHKPGELSTIYSCSAFNLVEVNPVFDDVENIIALNVGFGKKTIDAVNGRRFKFGVGFAPKQAGDGFDFTTLKTNIAPFYVHVGTDLEKEHYVVNFSI